MRSRWRILSVLFVLLFCSVVGYRYRNSSLLLDAIGAARGRDMDSASRRVVASHYGKGDGFHGQTTASGETFNKNRLTAAHRTLPFGTIVRLRNPDTGKSVQVRINDRGPYINGRTLDISAGAASALGFADEGVTQLEMTIISRPSQGG